jgi:hypothetical protein
VNWTEQLRCCQTKGVAVRHIAFYCAVVNNIWVTQVTYAKRTENIYFFHKRQSSNADIFYICGLLEYYTALSGSSVPTFRDTQRSHVQGSGSPRRLLDVMYIAISPTSRRKPEITPKVLCCQWGRTVGHVFRGRTLETVASLCSFCVQYE